jgi:general secretion pathway protein E
MAVASENKANKAAEASAVTAGGTALSSAALRSLAAAVGLPFVEVLPEPNPPRSIVRGDFDRIAGSWGRQFSTIPLLEREGVIVIATSDPLNIAALDQIKLCYQKPTEVVVSSSEELTKAINRIRTTLMSDRSSELSNDDDDASDEFAQQLKIDVTDAEDDDAPIIRYVNAIIFKASSERASDVHIEPFEEVLKVRFRIDGVLADIASEDKAFQAGIASRIKVMAGMNIAEKRLPQDGRIGIKIAGRDVDIRVNTVPTQYGERIVMRLLDKTATVLDLETLGFTGYKLDVLSQLIQKPNGIILVTGPTGSGKTTTLYSCLARINTPELNVLTVEDPIEYQLDGVGQMQVNPKIDFTFAAGLRAILRQDPDVVMVGEIRDGETAEIAIQASLTGHLVFSTLHTNDAAGSISRLLDMGVEPFLVSSSLLAVMAQRLVRKLCPSCKVPHDLTDEEVGELGLDASKLTSRGVFARNPEGCSYCSQGYLGRTGIHELLIINDELRSLITRRVDSSQIKNEAVKHGFKPLRADGAAKVLAGQTSVEEVVRVTHEE